MSMNGTYSLLVTSEYYIYMNLTTNDLLQVMDKFENVILLYMKSEDFTGLLDE